MRGFSLVELLLSLAIMLIVLAAMFALMNPAHATFALQPERADMQQRLRVAADVVGGDLRVAGAGTRGYLASIAPYRRGLESADSPGAFFNDRMSVMYVPASGPETVVDSPTDNGNAIVVRPRTGCPPIDPLCGFEVKMIVAIFDDSGAYDLVQVSGIGTYPPLLMYVGPTLSKSYAAGSRVAQVETATYWLKDAVSGTTVPQLMKYDGRHTDLPVADNVVDLRFEYFGDANVTEPSTPAVLLEPASFTDGPWRPDPAAQNRFDVDLLRIRRVRVSVRVRANWAFLPVRIADQEIQFDIAPRNLNLLP
jgi:prepilin-type N-terminal cleavage/methylation domain-containing protein